MSVSPTIFTNNGVTFRTGLGVVHV